MLMKSPTIRYLCLQIFFNESYLKEHPDHEEGVKKLRLLIEEQVREGGKERG